MSGKSVLEQLYETTFSLFHNPNCAMPFEIHLIGPGHGLLDNKHSTKTSDILGHGKTLEAAAEQAFQRLEEAKNKK